ncbi:MAG: glutamine--tRNA ligase/YqeY domain fusion protein [Candidatus Omnitrophica bacterium]|nr:glutamine--tRNA ligase/YqeY domain fusion protein [Candidatus Omnitrophota bacterium]
MENKEHKYRDFIRTIIENDIKNGRFEKKVLTRFPPEPNGYLHIGHAKSICLNFGIAEDFGGLCNLRFDDTNPLTESYEYVESIKEDIEWLGFKWNNRLYFSSDYFEKMYGYAVELVKTGKAYVDDLSAEQLREYRGTLTTPGKESPYRNRSIQENLELLEQMKNGKFEEGSRVLRAKIDMSSPNINMRDPIMYRIIQASHYRRENKWCIYPTYDWAHGLEDSIEGVTYSICTLEFEDHRPLYDWFLDALGVHHPQQIEFARLNLTYTILSKRFLLRLVQEGYVKGWDDPRMPTISGMRKRGYPAEAIRNFCDIIGISKTESVVDIELLEHCVREYLNKQTLRVMAVLNPIRLIIDNYPEGTTEELDAINNPEDLSAGTRKIPFSKTLYIEKDDFMETPSPKFYRLAPGREVRLRYAYFIKCTSVVKDEKTGEVKEIHCTYDPATKGGDAPDGRKSKTTLHWVSASHAINAETRIYDKLFTKKNPMDFPENSDFTINLNPQSLQVLKNSMLEPSLKNAKTGDRFQFERLGYFCVEKNTKDGTLIFNRTLPLRDEWLKIKK